MALLKKSDILKGINDPEKITINALDGELWLRPLSNSELDEIDKIESKGMESYKTTSKSRGRVQGETVANGEINVYKATVNSAKARTRKIEMSLDNPKNQDDPWTEDDINQLKRDAIEELIEKIDALSGVGVTEGDIDKFPEDD